MLNLHRGAFEPTSINSIVEHVESIIQISDLRKGKHARGRYLECRELHGSVPHEAVPKL